MPKLRIIIFHFFLFNVINAEYVSSITLKKIESITTSFTKSIESGDLERALQLKAELDSLYRPTAQIDEILKHSVWAKFPTATTWSQIFEMAGNRSNEKPAPTANSEKLDDSSDDIENFKKPDSNSDDIENCEKLDSNSDNKKNGDTNIISDNIILLKTTALSFVNAVKNYDLEEARKVKLELDNLYKITPLADNVISEVVWGAFPSKSSWEELFSIIEEKIAEIANKEAMEKLQTASRDFVVAVQTKDLALARKSKVEIDRLYKIVPLADNVISEVVWRSFPNKSSWGELFKIMNPKLPKLVHRDFDEKIAEKPIVILTASYNNSKWYKRNLASAFGQNYSNYRIIYIDDCSPDNTGNLVKEYVKLQNQDHRFTLIQNKERGLALYNIYYAIHLCNPEEIVVVLDGDDCFCHNNVLNIINKEYSTKDIWLTHGSCCYLSSGSRIEWCMPIPKNTINDNNFRQWPHGPTHVRTFYAWLFHKINLEDFLDKLGWFYRMSYDVAMFMPMLEMCGSRHSFIDEILYVYNDLNDINDHKVDTHLQHSLNHEIRNKSKYKVLKFGINNDLQ